MKNMFRFLLCKLFNLKFYNWEGLYLFNLYDYEIYCLEDK